MLSFERAPQLYARVGGFLSLAIIVFGLFGELVVRGTLVIAGDATATAEHIARSPEPTAWYCCWHLHSRH